jgi:hypothetical protein
VRRVVADHERTIDVRRWSGQTVFQIALPHWCIESMGRADHRCTETTMKTEAKTKACADRGEEPARCAGEPAGSGLANPPRMSSAQENQEPSPQDHRPKLDRLVAALIEHETVEQDEIAKLLAGPPRDVATRAVA